MEIFKVFSCDAIPLRSIDAQKNAPYAVENLCFKEGTPVVVESLDFPGRCSLRAIENMAVGELVLSRCEKTGEQAFKRVVSVFENGFRKISRVYYRYNNQEGNLYSTGVTSWHPFWVQDKGWVRAHDLQPGDELLTYDGYPTTVLRIERGYLRAEVFNLEVENFNTYFVEEGIWVHNCTNNPAGGAQ